MQADKEETWDGIRRRLHRRHQVRGQRQQIQIRMEARHVPQETYSQRISAHEGQRNPHPRREGGTHFLVRDSQGPVRFGDRKGKNGRKDKGICRKGAHGHA